jgi:hypothetical protein
VTLVGAQVVLFLSQVSENIHSSPLTGRLIAPLPLLFDHARRLFRTLYGNGSVLNDRLEPMYDLLIALTARQMGATVVTVNLQEFPRG